MSSYPPVIVRLCDRTQHDKDEAKARNDESYKRLRALLRQPGNATCSECTAQRPQWVILPYGVFCCENCAQIFRVDKSIYVTKGITTYLFFPDEVDLMEKYGNEVVNQFLMPGVPKMDAQAIKATRDEFIRNKYILRSWQQKGASAPVLAQQKKSLSSSSSSTPAAAATIASPSPAVVKSAPKPVVASAPAPAVSQAPNLMDALMFDDVPAAAAANPSGNDLINFFNNPNATNFNNNVRPMMIPQQQPQMQMQFRQQQQQPFQQQQQPGFAPFQQQQQRPMIPLLNDNNNFNNNFNNNNFCKPPPMNFQQQQQQPKSASNGWDGFW